MANEDLEFQITATDHASKIIDHVADSADKLEGKDATVDVTADDKASKSLDEVDRERKQLDGKDATVDVKAKDVATQRLDDVLRRTRELDGKDATVILKAEAGKATSEIRQLTKLLGEVDGDEATVVLKARDEATARLNTLNTELGRVNSAPAVGQIQALRNEVSNAEGFITKLGVAGNGAMTAIQGASAATMAAAAGTAAAVVGAIKLVGDSFTLFQETARAARDLGAASGLTPEEASRWIAVADDFGLSADQLTGSLTKIGKTIDASKWAQYGIETRDAGGHAKSVNDILLDTFDVLSKMPNETERNKAGNALLGKGYKDLAPLIGNTRKEMEGYLAAVEDGQVITKQELARAEDMRRAQDNLADAFGEVELAIGGVVPLFAGYVDGAANVVSWAGKAANALTGLFGGSNDDAVTNTKQIDKMVENSKKWAKSNKEIRDGLIERGVASDDADEGMKRAGLAIQDMGDISDDATDATKALKDAQDAEAKAAQDSADAAQASADAHKAAADALLAQSDAMRSAADSTFALHDAQQQFDEQIAGLPDKLKEAKGDLRKVQGALDDVAKSAGAVADAQVRVAEDTATASGKHITATQKLDIWNQSMLDAASTMKGPQRDALLDYIANVNGIPPQVVTDIAALLDAGSVTAADQALTAASTARTATITARAETTQAEKDLTKVATAKWVAEITAILTPKGAAASLINFGKGGASAGGTSVAPAGPTTINVNLPRGARHTDIARAMNMSTRRSGRRFGNPVVHYARR